MVERATQRFEAGQLAAPQPGETESGPALQAIVVPLTLKQLDEATTNFDTWLADRQPLGPGQTPFADLIVVLNNGDVADAHRVISEHPAVQANFVSVHVLSADLRGADDAYKIGDATGANNLFFFSLGALRNYSVFLLMETDVQPMRAQWLQDAAKCVATQMGTKWVMGAQYRGDGPMAGASGRERRCVRIPMMGSMQATERQTFEPA